ncbi:MAG: amino acid permease [Sulfobacillus sp.]|nr:amino acid permease [Sulfobacillus sp.]
MKTIKRHPSASKPTETRLVARQYGAGPRAKPPKHLTAGTLSLMTVGGIMGSGLFLASGPAIRLAGPAILVAYLIGVTIMALEVTALAEMAATDHERGSFLAFAHHALGEGYAFVGGWIFWFSSILNLAAEATAGALFTRVWFPGIPVFIFAMAYAAIITGINFLTVKGFSRVESIMSYVKIGATALFIIVAFLAIFHLIPATGPHGPQLWWRHPGFFPHGWSGVAASMVLVLFSMSGTGVLGLAAPNLKHPEHVMGHTIRTTVITIYLLYGLSALALTGMTWWAHMPTTKSPFTVALGHLPWGWPMEVFNVIILVAVLSAMNAGLFATNRVLATLGRIHAAPAGVARESSGIPRRANLISGILLILFSGLAYFLPRTAYTYLVTATGFQALFIWILIVVTEIYYRPKLLAQGHRLEFRMPGYPWTSWLAVLLMVGVIATAPLAPHELIPLGLGIFVVLLLVGIYWLRARNRAESH